MDIRPQPNDLKLQILATILAPKVFKERIKSLCRLQILWQQLIGLEELKDYLRQTISFLGNTRWDFYKAKAKLDMLNRWPEERIRQELGFLFADEFMSRVEEYTLPEGISNAWVAGLKTSTALEPDAIAKLLAEETLADGMAVLLEAALIWAWVEDVDVIKEDATESHRYQVVWKRKDYASYVAFSVLCAYGLF